MGSHLINLAIRFLLEIVALISIGAWGWNKTDGFYRYILAIGLPMLIAIIWGVFAVPNDPSRSGQTVIETSGILRLGIEFVIFAVATLALFNEGHLRGSIIFAVIVIVHYLFSCDRVVWLLEN
ncbi:UNVERIFIED_CONTAM: hypothetical protein GTU68_028553 [Idotea baltica]|nr:hypothetical protein [Idotea baltica]